MEQLIRRVDRVEERIEANEAKVEAKFAVNDARYLVLLEVISEVKVDVSSLKAFRDNERAKHSSQPTWLFGTISAAISIAALLFNLYLAGLRP